MGQNDLSLINFYFGNFEYFDPIYWTEDSQNGVLNNMQLLDKMFFSRYHKKVFFIKNEGTKCVLNHKIFYLVSQKRVDPSYKSLSLQFKAYKRSILLNTLHNGLRQAFYTVIYNMTLTFDEES